MCEYQRFDPNSNNQLPLCTVTNDLCTYCIFGNAKTYREAKEKEEN